MNACNWTPPPDIPLIHQSGLNLMSSLVACLLPSCVPVNETAFLSPSGLSQKKRIISTLTPLTPCLLQLQMLSISPFKTLKSAPSPSSSSLPQVTLSSSFLTWEAPTWSQSWVSPAPVHPVPCCQGCGALSKCKLIISSTSSHCPP